MAYRFMTEPLSVNDLTVAKKDNLEGQEVKFEVSDEKKEAEEKTIEESLKELDTIVEKIAGLGGTPLVVEADAVIYGVIYLKDTVKPGLVERFQRLREIGIKTIMCTGDNPLTAATIAKEAGVDGFIAECRLKIRSGPSKKNRQRENW